MSNTRQFHISIAQRERAGSRESCSIARPPQITPPVGGASFAGHALPGRKESPACHCGDDIRTQPTGDLKAPRRRGSDPPHERFCRVTVAVQECERRWCQVSPASFGPYHPVARRGPGPASRGRQARRQRTGCTGMSETASQVRSSTPTLGGSLIQTCRGRAAGTGVDPGALVAVVDRVGRGLW